ncbi:MAG: hypothetical protein QOD72_2611, partial [Acidimicrobiaceae bacterium]|nr:hypothetical protein [Acidimicrobiaceae bacterium]
MQDAGSDVDLQLIAESLPHIVW